jgi:RNA-binding protein YlmH
MKKSSLSFLGNLSEEDKIFANSVADKIYAADERYRTGFTFFLGEGKAEIARKVLASQSYENYLFFGGHKDAERLMLGIFPEFEDPTEEAFPITALTFSYRAQDKLTHRDFLGALMGLNISRDTVGDIVVGESEAYAFLTDTAAVEAFNGISKIGRAGVKISRGYNPDDLPEREFKEISGTVSSLRIDCVVSLAARCSRTKAEQLVSSGAVAISGQTVLSGAKKIDEGESFSVRGSGKFILEKIGKSTKKERTFIEIKKFI